MARIEFDTSDSALYCDTSDVARWFEQYDDFEADTEPSREEVEAHIFEWMEHIDRQTGHAWRANTVVEEMKDWDGQYVWGSGRPLNLGKRDVRDFDSAQGDKLEHWDGSSWDDWLTNSAKTKGRNNNYWLDRQAGILWVFDRFAFHRPEWRITYRYGNPNGATRAIQMACAKLVAADLASSDQYSMNIPGTDGGQDETTSVEQWREDAERVIEERRETQYIEPY